MFFVKGFPVPFPFPGILIGDSCRGPPLHSSAAGGPFLHESAVGGPDENPKQERFVRREFETRTICAVRKWTGNGAPFPFPPCSRFVPALFPLCSRFCSRSVPVPAPSRVCSGLVPATFPLCSRFVPAPSPFPLPSFRRNGAGTEREQSGSRAGAEPERGGHWAGTGIMTERERERSGNRAGTERKQRGLRV